MSECAVITLPGGLRVPEVKGLKPLLQFLQVFYLLLVSMPSVSSAPFFGDPKLYKGRTCWSPSEVTREGCLVRVTKRACIVITRKEAPLSPPRDCSDSGLALRDHPLKKYGEGCIQYLFWLQHPTRFFHCSWAPDAQQLSLCGWESRLTRDEFNPALATFKQSHHHA